MDPLSVLLFIVLFGLSALVSASEIAILSLPQHKVKALVRQHKDGSRSLQHIKNNVDVFLITVAILINLLTTITAAFATKVSLGMAWVISVDPAVAVLLTTWVITLLLIIFGEIIPKSFATHNAEPLALRVSGLFVFLQKLLFPIIRVLQKITRTMHRTQAVTWVVTEEDIESLIEMWKQHGVFEKGEYEKIRNMLDFYEVSAQEIMTPRVDLDALEDNVTVDEALEQMMEFSHSRIPVYNNTIDDIYGVVTFRDLLTFKKKKKGAAALHKLSLKKVIKVPLTKPIHTVLDLFSKNRHHMAIVIDEYGGVAWVLTLEDIIEHVFGDIQDETDKEKSALTQRWEDLITVQGFITMDELFDHLGFDFAHMGISEDTFSWETLSYFITSFLERFPVKNEVINLPVYGDDIQWRKMQLIIKSVADDTVGEVSIVLK